MHIATRMPLNEKGGPRTGEPIDLVTRRARRLIYAAAFGLLLIGVLSACLGLESLPHTAATLWQELRDGRVDSMPMLLAVPAVGFVATALVLRRSRRMASGEARRLARGHLWIAAMAGLYAVGMLFGGSQYALSSRLDFQAERLAQQVAIARLKARQIDDWAHERMMTLRFLASSLRAMPLDETATSPELR